MRRSKTNPVTLAASAAAVIACAGALGFYALSAADQRTADQFGCYEGVAMPRHFALVDASLPRWNEDQQRSLLRGFTQTYKNLAFNERFAVYTTEGDMVGDVLSPRFHICGQTTSAAVLEEIGAAGGMSGYLIEQKKRLLNGALKPELDALFAIEPQDERAQRHQSPLLEMLQSLSREPGFEPGASLTLVSDLIANSDSVQFCRRFNDLPHFSAFRQRPVYQKLKPRSFEGVKVMVLMLQRFGYGQGGLEYCSGEDELIAFWRAYFEDNGATNIEFIRLRHGGTGV